VGRERRVAAASGSLIPDPHLTAAARGHEDGAVALSVFEQQVWRSAQAGHPVESIAVMWGTDVESVKVALEHAERAVAEDPSAVPPTNERG
jgi:hypothetical protein